MKWIRNASLVALSCAFIAPSTISAVEKVSFEENVPVFAMNQVEDMMPRNTSVFTSDFDQETYEHIAPNQIAFVSTWQEFEHAVNSPVIDLIRIQNDISIPVEAELSMIQRIISIEGDGYHLDLGVHQLNVDAEMLFFENIKISGLAEVLISNRSTASNNLYLANVEGDLNSGQTFMEGNSTFVFMNGQNLFLAQPVQAVPVVFKTSGVGIYGKVDVVDTALYDGTGSSFQPSQIVNFGELNGHINNLTDKPFINNAEVLSVNSNSTFYVLSASRTPVIEFSKADVVYDTSYIEIGSNASVSLKNKGPIVSSTTSYQLFSHGNNTIYISSLVSTLGVEEIAHVVLRGTDNVYLENSSGGALLKGNQLYVGIEEVGSIVPFNFSLRQIGHTNIPPSIFWDIAGFATLQASDSLQVASDNQELVEFVHGIDGLWNISKLQVSPAY